jgi:acetate kinase
MSDPAAGQAPGTILCLNAGSSSLKFALFQRGTDGEEELAAGSVEGLSTPNAHASLSVSGRRSETPSKNDHAGALAAAFELLDRGRLPRATLVGHRVVHGGPDHVQPALIDAALLGSLRALVPLAPLHMPAALAGIEAASRELPEAIQVACFDTSFHAQMPDIAKRLALPSALYDSGIRRYGFHGLSYEYVLSRLGVPLPARIVIAHLGNGSSLAAVQNGRSVDTTMGFTPGGGIMMGTRSGDVDPGVVLYLLREKQLSADAVEQTLERESGLLGVGGASDVKTLIERAPTDPRARLALSMFGYSVRKAIGGYIAALGGLDLLVFTGGIGEHTPSIRADACLGLEAFGVELDPARNSRNDALISAEHSRCRVQVVATDEDKMVARHARAVAGGAVSALTPGR